MSDIDLLTARVRELNIQLRTVRTFAKVALVAPHEDAKWYIDRILEACDAAIEQSVRITPVESEP